jgi:hypothetical protein
MNNFKIYKTKKLVRKHSEMYLTTATLKEIQNWELGSAMLQTKQEVTYIYSDQIKVIKDGNGLYDLEVINGHLANILPELDLKEEIPVLISNGSKESLLVNAILQIDTFKQIVELKSSKISNNSTKVMTVKTLERLLYHVFEEFTLEEISFLLNDFLIYIEEVISKYDFFKYYSVKHIKELKNSSIINSSVSWFIIFKYFVENYQNNVYKTRSIPKLNLDVEIDNWKGNFFDKCNPLWEKVFYQKRKYYPSKENLETTYKIWFNYL